MKEGEDTGKDKLEGFEKFAMYSLLIGACMFSTGIGLSIFTPRGLPAILGMAGAFMAFMATVLLIFAWLVQEWRGG